MALEILNDWDAVTAFVKVSHAKAQGREEHFSVYFVCFVI
jgi:hypothetical protein